MAERQRQIVMADDVLEMREDTGRGTFDCCRILKGRAIKANIASATTLEELKVELLDLVDFVRPEV